jgi:hypothetical protein
MLKSLSKFKEWLIVLLFFRLVVHSRCEFSRELENIRVVGKGLTSREALQPDDLNYFIGRTLLGNQRVTVQIADL